MEVTTARRFAPMPSRKSWSWSYSRLKNFENCPHQYNHVSILKDVVEPEGEALQWGNRVHTAAAARLSPARVPLEKEFATLEPWCHSIEMGAVGGTLLTEQQLAINDKHQPAGWFAPDAWLRVVIDVATLKPPVALLVDWKTGKILEDSVQLALSGAVLFAHYPNIRKIRSAYVWLKDGAESVIDMTPDDLPVLWEGLQPRLTAMELATITGDYPMVPSGLCKRFCPVVSCRYHGVGTG